MTAEKLAAAVRAALDGMTGAAAERPFGPDVRVWKVAGKMFALMPVKSPASVSLKCDPHLAEILREAHPGITAGYHLNKRHWNTISLKGDVPEEEVMRLAGHSYDLVRASLTRAQRAVLDQLDHEPGINPDSR